MADTLASLEAVYNKWEQRNPYKTKGGLAATNGTRLDYPGAIEQDKACWKRRFASAATPAPPPLQEKYRRRPRGLQHRTWPTRGYSAQGSYSASNLATFKMMPMVMPSDEVVRRPYMGRCCACMPTSKVDHMQAGVESAKLHDILRVPTSSKRNGWWTRTFSHISFVMQRDVSHKYPDVSMAVLTSNKVIEAVQKVALQELGAEQIESVEPKTLRKAVSKQRKRSKSIMKQMQATMSNSFIRLTGWFLHKLLGRLFSSIVVHTGQMKVLANVCKRDLPVIFLPTHQSHMDYILLTFILFNYDLRAPHVAAGDNLRIPLFGSMMRSLGGYFIRRKLDGNQGTKDFIYRSVLHTYMQELLRNGQFFEFFIEGGRTRTGKALYPKGGLLSVIVDCYLDGTIPDVYLAPVSISYEKLLDGSFATELQGLPKHQETFWRACNAIWHVIWGKFGNVRVDFGQPFSLKEFLLVCQSQLAAIPDETPYTPGPMCRSYSSNMSLYSDMASDDHRITVQTLAQHVIHSCVNLRAVMSTQLTAFLLLTKHRQGVSLGRLVGDVDWLVEDLRGRGRDIGFSGHTAEVVLYACELLGEHLIRVETKSEQKNKGTEGDLNNNPSVLFLRPVISINHTLELSYYANAVVPDFALESVLALCLLSELDAQKWVVTQGSPEEQPTVMRAELLAAATHLIHLLHVDFIMKPPCDNLDSTLDKAIDHLLAWDIISTNQEAPSVEVQRANRLARSLEWGVDSEDSEDESQYTPETIYKIDMSPHSIRRLHFLQSVLAPLIETYYVVLLEAIQLATKPRAEKEFVSHVYQQLVDRVTSDVATYVESANLVSVKSAVQALLQLHLVEPREVAGSPPGGTSIQLTIDTGAKEHVQHLLDLLVNYDPSPLGPPKAVFATSA